MEPLRNVASRCDYTSEFSDVDSEVDHQLTVARRDEKALYKKPFTDQKLGLFHSTGSSRAGKPPSKRFLASEIDRNEGKRMRYHGILAMDAFTRHQKFVNDYLTYYGGKREDFLPTDANTVTDTDIIRENNQFLWEGEEKNDDLSWEKRLAKKYWDKLYKEYAIADLSRFKENKVALRWRIEKEVVSGKGQFTCGDKRCNEKDGLRSWEVNFAYMEGSDKKNALVKLRLCPECSYKLNYHHKKREVTRKKILEKEKKKEKKHKKNKKEKHKKSDDLERNIKKPESTSELDPVDNSGENIWSQPVQVEQEKSREEEFDTYFDDLFQ